MFCIDCGNEIADGAKFCPICGTKQGKGEIGGIENASISIPEYSKKSLDLIDEYKKLSTPNLLKLAEKHEPIVWSLLGDRYQDGEGIEQSNHAAFKWYKKSSDAGEARGINCLAHCYDKGKGVEEDKESAAELYGQSAHLGWLPGIANYAFFLINGIGVEKDQKKSAQWLRLGAEMGNIICQFNLGCAYQYGRGVEQDYSRAIYWYQKVAKQNDGDGFLNLGYMYGHGLGIEKDDAKAFELYMKAAKLGVVNAMLNVAFDYMNGRGVKKNLAKANEWFLKAAEEGNERAMFSLGYNYEYGHGVPENWDEAYTWYRKAAKQGNKAAEFKEKFSRLYLRGFPSYPENVKPIKFERVSGTVLDHERNSETHVSSYGGGGYVGSYGGHVSAAQVESHVTTTDDFWIEDEHGNETHITLINKNVPLRVGQKISIYNMSWSGATTGGRILLINHSDGNIYKLMDSSAIDKEVNCIYKSSLIALLLKFGLLYILFTILVPILTWNTPEAEKIVWVAMVSCVLFRSFRRHYGKKNVRAAIASRIQAIISWENNED